MFLFQTRSWIHLRSLLFIDKFEFNHSMSLQNFNHASNQFINVANAKIEFTIRAFDLYASKATLSMVISQIKLLLWAFKKPFYLICCWLHFLQDPIYLNLFLFIDFVITSSRLSLVWILCVYVLSFLLLLLKQINTYVLNLFYNERINSL